MAASEFDTTLARQRAVDHITVIMSAPAPVTEGPRPLSAEDLFDFWLRRSNEFMAWQEKNFILSEPPAEALAEHGKRLDLMLGLTLHIYSMASRSMPEKLSTIRGRLWQLEDSRELVHNPMSHEEADAILKRVFPDERGTPGPA
jgi:hypothetical protein